MKTQCLIYIQRESGTKQWTKMSFVGQSGLPGGRSQPILVFGWACVSGLPTSGGKSGTLMNMSCWYLLLLHLYMLTFARKLGSLDWLKTYFTGFSFIWWSNSTKIMFSVGFPNQTNPLNHTFFRWLASRCFVFPTGYLHVPGLYMWWSYPMTFRFLQMV
jgi:hypothetical protein